MADSGGGGVKSVGGCGRGESDHPDIDCACESGEPLAIGSGRYIGRRSTAEANENDEMFKGGGSCAR